MRQLIAVMPDKVYYTLDYVRETIIEQNTKYNNACHTLYMLDFSSSPCYFDEKEVLRALLEYAPDAKGYLLNMCKFKIGFTVGRCKYAEMAYKGQDKTLQQVFHAIRCVLESKKALEDLIVVTGRKFNTRGKHRTSHKVILTPTASIHGKYPELKNPDIWGCVDMCREMYVTKIPYTGLLHKLLARFLKIAEADYLQHEKENRPLFLENVTFAEEVTLAKYLIEGDLYLTGDFAPEYENEYYAYLDSDPAKQGSLAVLPEFSTYVLGNTSNDFFLLGQKIDNEQKPMGRLPLLLTEEEIWYYTPSSSKKSRMIPMQFEVGSFFTVNGEESMHNYFNQLLGYAGEFFKKEDITEEKYEVSLDMFNLNGNMLPSTVIINKNTKDNIYTQSGSKGYELTPKDLNKFLEKRKISSLDNFEAQVNLSDVALHLTKTLLCIIFDTTLEGYTTPYEVKLDRVVQEEEFVEACRTACKIVEDLQIN